MPTHTRIRMFNTKETYPNQALNNDLCQAVRAGNTVYVRGQVGTDFAGNLIGLGDPRAQAEQAMKNVEQLLKEAGSDLSHIVKTTTYLIDPRYREPVYQEVGKWLKGVFPISTVAFGTEGGLFDEMGVATLVCGPGSMAQGHKADEYISIAQTERCMTMLRQLCAWMRAEPAEPLT